MTHFFSVSENEMIQLNNGSKTFDILKFNRSVSVGDTILYQLVPDELEEGEDREGRHEPLPEELSFKIDFLFDDTEGALKKGYCGVGFKTEI